MNGPFAFDARPVADAPPLPCHKLPHGIALILPAPAFPESICFTMPPE